MHKEIHPHHPWTKSIPANRDRLQSSLLVWTLPPLLYVLTALRLISLHFNGLPQQLLAPAAIASTFALLVVLLRAATLPAALLGAVICFNFLTAPTSPASPHHGLWTAPAFPALIALFVFTFLATRFGCLQKQSAGLAESRHGRRAAQVAANLGIAGLCAFAGWHLACIAALAQATADTVSSEIGQALQAPTFLITTGHPVPRGTDGGVSLAGTIWGTAAAAIVVVLTFLVAHLPWASALLCWFAACVGLAFDSLLGATLERRGLLGNDLVNLTSTAFAATLALALHALVTATR